MRQWPIIPGLLVAIGACGTPQPGVPIDRNKAVAERFFRGVYEGDGRVVDELAAEEIVASYPIFSEIFGDPVVRGKAAYRAHAENFAKTWTGGSVTIHESIAEGDRIVLVWSFSGRRVDDGDAGGTPRYASWGGITMLRVDSNQQVLEEIGEESDPGPVGRLLQSRGASVAADRGRK